MRSWVRYSVSAYLGLLLAGSIAQPTPAINTAPNPTMRETRKPVTTQPGTPAYPMPADPGHKTAFAQS